MRLDNQQWSYGTRTPGVPFSITRCYGNLRYVSSMMLVWYPSNIGGVEMHARRHRKVTKGSPAQCKWKQILKGWSQLQTSCRLTIWLKGQQGSLQGGMYMVYIAQWSQAHWRQVSSAQISNGNVAPEWSVKLNLEVDEALDSKVSGNHYEITWKSWVEWADSHFKWVWRLFHRLGWVYGITCSSIVLIQNKPLVEMPALSG
jgi:hypothetical protein